MPRCRRKERKRTHYKECECAGQIDIKRLDQNKVRVRLGNRYMTSVAIIAKASNYYENATLITTIDKWQDLLDSFCPHHKEEVRETARRFHANNDYRHCQSGRLCIHINCVHTY